MEFSNPKTNLKLHVATGTKWVKFFEPGYSHIIKLYLHCTRHLLNFVWATFKVAYLPPAGKFLGYLLQPENKLNRFGMLMQLHHRCKSEHKIIAYKTLQNIKQYICGNFKKSIINNSVIVDGNQ